MTHRIPPDNIQAACRCCGKPIAENGPSIKLSDTGLLFCSQKCLLGYVNLVKCPLAKLEGSLFIEAEAVNGLDKIRNAKVIDKENKQ